MLLHDEDEAARDDAHAHREEEADGLDGVDAQAHVREALVFYECRSRRRCRG